MHFIYLQQSGKPVENSAGTFWTLAAVAVDAERWRTLQLRVNGLQKSFQKDNYKPGVTRINANDLLHPRNAERDWTIAYCKGLEKICSTLDLKFFIVVVDKRTTDKPPHPKWLLPLSYHYLLKPISQFLKESNSVGTLVIPPGRDEERQAITEIQFANVFSPIGKSVPIVGSPLVQTEGGSAGLQVADFVATITRRYQEFAYPKLFRKDVLVGYDAVINSHYQGFVKPLTYQSAISDAKGFRIRGYIYLWRREGVSGSAAQQTRGQFPAGGDDLIETQPAETARVGAEEEQSQK
ncbi:MAG: hypothetical protein ABI579_05090 [Candidatus Sumerlaeota bacterium]